MNGLSTGLSPGSSPGSSPGVLLRNALRMLWRDWRSGELTILCLSLLIAITSMTAVGFFTDRIERGMQQQAAELLGADLVVASSRDDLDALAAAARAAGLSTTRVVQFRSVVIAADQPRLVEVKAVAEHYPLRGKLQLASLENAPPQVVDHIPARGEVWAESRLFQQLNAAPGEVIALGAAPFKLQTILAYEPDRGGDFFSVSPRVLMHIDDLAATQLLQHGALVKYRLLIAGERGAIAAFRAELASLLGVGQELLGVEDGRPELRNALQTAQRFLALATLVSVLLAGVAIATTAYRFTQRHLDTCAMLRCLGMRQAGIIRLFALEMLLLALVVSSIGCALGALAQLAIAALLDQLVLASLPAASFKPVLLGYASGVLLLLGFALPPMLSLQQVPPLHVLRRVNTAQRHPRWPLYLAVTICLAVLLQWQVNDGRLVFATLAGMALGLLLLALTAWLLVAILSRLRQRVGIAWRFGFANIARRRGQSVIQIIAFGLGIMILLLLTSARNDLLQQWQTSLPAHAPNHFIINVQTGQLDAIKQYFAQNAITDVTFYPMVRARLTAINHRLIHTDDYENERAKHMLTREFNLSWAAQPQKDNRISAGAWWQADAAPTSELSLEAGLAQTLRITLHDTLSFDINGTTRDFTVSSLREVNWDSFNVNFFTVVPPGVLDASIASWVSSVYLDADTQPAMISLVNQFPNVTVINVDIIMQRVRSIMQRVTLAVEFIFLFTLAAGFAVLYAAIQSQQDERRYENAVLRTLGASRHVLLRGLLAEFIALGAAAGLIAGLAASALAYVLATEVFNFSYAYNPYILLSGVLLGIIGIGIAGLAGTYRVLSHPPMQSLRQGA